MAETQALISSVNEALAPRASVRVSRAVPAIREPRWSRRVVLVAGTLATMGAGVLLCARGRLSAMPERPLGGEVTELENACDLYPYLKFEVPDAVVYNNLANKGPDQGSGEGIVYKTIDLGRGAGDEFDKEVIMTINASSKNYAPFSPRLNGMQGKYGSINLNSGSEVDLLFRFFDRDTGNKLFLPEFAITWFDLDTGNGLLSKEYVTMGGFKSYHLTDATEVIVEKQIDGRTKFSGSTKGTGEDNPVDPMFLTHQQRNRAVTLLYDKTESLLVTIGATEGGGPRFFTFIGRPSLLCAVTVQQSFKPPLPDLTFSPPLEGAVMTGEGSEKLVAFHVTKGQEVRKGDVIATTQEENKPPKDYTAPFDGTVTQLQDKLKPGEKLDLRLSEKILAVVKRPTHEPLPQTPGVIAGGPGKDDSIPGRAKFVQYLVDVGDRVQKGDPIAVLKKEDGNTFEAKSAGYGVVHARQEDLKKGALLASVMDENLVTLGPYPSLGPLSGTSKAAAIVPGGDEYLFSKYHIKEGDTVNAGDEIATVKDNYGGDHIIAATNGGVVSSLQELKPGTPIDRVEDRNLCVTGKFPPLPVEPGSAPLDYLGGAGTPAPQADAPAGIGGGLGEYPLPQQDVIVAEGLTFERYYIQPGYVLETGDKVARVRSDSGREHDVLAPRPGVVKHVVSGLRKGMVLRDVMPDTNLATIARLPKLDVTAQEDGAFAPRMDNWRFKEWQVIVGENVKKGQAIASLDKLSGATKSVLASKSGTVTELLKHLQRGDIVEEATADDDLAVIGLFQEPDVGFREVGVQVPAMDCVFSSWRVKEGDRVHVGDPIADIEIPEGRRLTEKGDVRLLQAGIMTVPSPGTGTVSYQADLVPGQPIDQQSAGPTIAKVNLGLPWWLGLFGATLVMCCCFRCLAKIMRKPPPYKIMPPITPPSPTPEPVLDLPEPYITPRRTKSPARDDSLRLDFDDNGVIQTVYAKYRPLGIKHGHIAPVVAHDFICNSYAKQELGVKEGWKLTRVGDTELDDTTDFDYVNNKLAFHMKRLPVWPLPLEFRKNPDDEDTHSFLFTTRPLGMEFSNVAPIYIDKIYPNSPAARANVDIGWFLTKIGDFDVHTNHDFKEVFSKFKESVMGLTDDTEEGSP